jgi:4-amino-4-deoxy-L-arabinose transferase-like glycosyltransferase
MAGPDRLTTSRFAPIWVLILALLSFWVGLAELPVQDRDEARYAQASRQMAETGDWVDIRFQDRGAPREAGGRLLDAGRGAGG